LIRRGATQEQIDAVYREPSPNPRHEREFKPFVPNPELFEFKDDVKPTGLYTDLAKRALHMNAALDYAEEVKKETKTRGQKKLRNMAGVAFEKGTGSIKAKIADGMDPIEAEFKGNLEANRFFAEYDGG